MATTSSSNGGTTKWGQGLTQNDLMEKDTVLVLNDKDEIIGSASKKDSHVFSPKQPRAILHRAFSVFLFDKSDGRLLLQQRASTKITFPNVRAACLFGRLLACFCQDSLSILVHQDHRFSPFELFSVR